MGRHENRHNSELQKLYRRPNIVSYMRNKKLEWVRHVWGVDG